MLARQYGLKLWRISTRTHGHTHTHTHTHLQTAKLYARELFEVLKLLKRTRDMSVNEVKLVISIDDPRGKVRWL